MKRSRDRILTTHAGSLARPDALRALLAAKDEGAPFDAAALAAKVRDAVSGLVRQQVAVGLDVINDGEQSKRNFTTYARERLGGIEERVLRLGERVLAQIYGRDAAEFPEDFAGRGTLAGRGAACMGPVTRV